MEFLNKKTFEMYLNYNMFIFSSLFFSLVFPVHVWFECPDQEVEITGCTSGIPDALGYI